MQFRFVSVRNEWTVTRNAGMDHVGETDKTTMIRFCFCVLINFDMFSEHEDKTSEPIDWNAQIQSKWVYTSTPEYASASEHTEEIEIERERYQQHTPWDRQHWIKTAEKTMKINWLKLVATFIGWSLKWRQWWRASSRLEFIDWMYHKSKSKTFHVIRRE